MLLNERRVPLRNIDTYGREPERPGVVYVTTLLGTTFVVPMADSVAADLLLGMLDDAFRGDGGTVDARRAALDAAAGVYRSKDIYEADYPREMSIESSLATALEGRFGVEE